MLSTLLTQGTVTTKWLLETITRACDEQTSSFLWGSSWRVGYSHMLSRHIGWAFGYEGQVLMAQNPLRAVLSQNRLSLSLEVAF